MSLPPVGRLAHTGHLIRRAQQLHAALWNQEVSTEVTSVQYAALAVIERTPGINQRELGDALDFDRSTIADLIARMERRGLVTRERRQTDKRQMILDITDDGRHTLRELDPRVARVEELLTASLESHERDELRSLLNTVLAGAMSSTEAD